MHRRASMFNIAGFLTIVRNLKLDRVVWCGLITASSVLAATPALSKTIDLENCKRLETEQASLTDPALLEHMAKGPEWVKSSLPANRVNKILRYLRVSEIVQFRCQDVFAIEDIKQARLKAKEAARLVALSNIPPPPERRPKVAIVSTPKGLIRIPPLPQKRD